MQRLQNAVPPTHYCGIELHASISVQSWKITVAVDYLTITLLSWFLVKTTIGIYSFPLNALVQSCSLQPFT